MYQNKSNEIGNNSDGGNNEQSDLSIYSCI